MSIDQAFNASIEYYDDWMKTALLNYADVFGTAQEFILFPSSAPIDVLDLGAGTGLFSQHVLEKYPKARFVLSDLADKMLGVARARFRQYSDQFQFLVGDYRAIQLSHQFDLVISSLSIHHLIDTEKQALFRAIHGLLRERGAWLALAESLTGGRPEVGGGISPFSMR